VQEETEASPLPSCRRVRGVRRAAALLVALDGVVAVASALSPPAAGRLRWLAEVLPLEIAVTATGVTVALGLLLLPLALGLARGQRGAWRLTVAVLAAAVAGHLVKGLDVEEAAAAGATLAWLVVVRARFRAPGRTAGLARELAAVAATMAGALTLAVVVLVTTAGQGWGQALVGVLGWLQGAGPAPTSTAQRFVEVGVDVLAPGGLFAALLLLVRRGRVPSATHLAAVRPAVLAEGTDSLAYFALRDDKAYLVVGDSVVAYAVFGRVALVSPDPVGPPEELERAITAFRAFAAEQGWIMAVLAAAPRAAVHYRRVGLATLYLGDEAVARLDNLELAGHRAKPLRGAHRRAVRAGYTAAFLDPARLGGAQRADLEALAVGGRRGEAERGFSMTLGRLFDPRDTGLLLAVAYGPDGRPGAFAQFVPAADVGGWSLDVMRRAEAIPSGLMDFLLVETMRHVAAGGATGISLNFATLRAVVQATPQGGTERAWFGGAERRLLHSLSQTFQIESLLRFTAKYDPDWRPRYLAYEHPAHLAEIAAAVARAESFWEIPVVGRLLRPRQADVLAGRHT
jgi:lysylphosphatidylglycerol synthetase-like protein (DUF2156 family)